MSPWRLLLSPSSPPSSLLTPERQILCWVKEQILASPWTIHNKQLSTKEQAEHSELVEERKVWAGLAGGRVLMWPGDDKDVTRSPSQM